MNICWRPRHFFSSLIYSIRLQFNALLLSLRSRHGFTNMLIVFRFFTFVVLLGWFFAEGRPGAVLSAAVLGAYLVLLLLFAVLFQRNGNRLDNSLYHLAIIVVDVVVIDSFISLSTGMQSELYLLLLLPLVTTAHFLPRSASVLVSVLIVLSYWLTLDLKFDLLTAGENLQWVGRSGFMLAATWLYRVQRNLPNANETSIISPTRTRQKIEELLNELKGSIPYDTISVQILYRGQLQIVACWGFPHPEEITKLEFPANDPSYPNHLVIESGRAQIANPKDYPSFGESQFSAGHIHSWIGAPLLSPATNECFGMISIDSSQADAYKPRDLRRATWFAREVSRMMIEASLGPAAMTLATKRDNLQTALKSWKELLPKKTSVWDDDLQASKDLAELGKKIFNVEDCSIYFLRSYQSDGGEEQLLHLVASSTIPADFFNRHEIKVTGLHGDGLTGYSVARDRSLNYGAAEIRNSPFRGIFTEHLQFLFSKRSRQLMIVPLHDSKGRRMGAIKVENKLGWSSDHRFLDIELTIFQLYAVMVSTMLENIRQRNFINRQSRIVHSVRALIFPTAVKPLGEMIASAKGNKVQVALDSLEDVHTSINYTRSILDGVLLDSTEDLLLENEGLAAALRQYLTNLKSMQPLQAACDRIRLEAETRRDLLPFRVRVALYNIAREAILNMVRYSKIEEIEGGTGRLVLSMEDEMLHMKVEDNGSGFDVESKKRKAPCFGLREMDAQLAVLRNMGLQAGIDKRSEPGRGTLIHVWTTLA